MSQRKEVDKAVPIMGPDAKADSKAGDEVLRRMLKTPPVPRESQREQLRRRVRG